MKTFYKPVLTDPFQVFLLVLLGAALIAWDGVRGQIIIDDAAISQFRDPECLPIYSINKNLAAGLTEKDCLRTQAVLRSSFEITHAETKAISISGLTAFDNFDRTDNYTVGLPSSGGSTPWTETQISSEIFRARIQNNVLRLHGCSGLTGTTGGTGSEFIYFDISAKYSSIYSAAEADLNWAFNMRSSNSTPSGFGSNTYATTVVLGCDEPDFRSPAADGYAVVIGNTLSPDPVKLIYFTGGLTANSNVTDIAVSNFTNAVRYYSVEVSYSPCNDSWILGVRDDGTSSFDDPAAGIYNEQIVGTNATHTTKDLKYFGAFWQHSGSCSEFAEFDNFNIPSSLSEIKTYTWNGNSSDYQLANNWTPSRNCQKINDILQFTSASPPVSTVTNVPTQTIGQLLVSGNRSVTFRDVAADALPGVISLSGGTGIDFEVEPGSSFIHDVASSNHLHDAIEIKLLAGTTASISGTITFQNSNPGTAGRKHRLLGSATGGITLNNGAIFTVLDLSGNPFGDASNSSTPNLVVFYAGSTYEHYDGANPFALTQPASKVIFSTGSTYRHKTPVSPSLMGRTYPNFEYDCTIDSVNFDFGSSSAAWTVDNLKILRGVFYISASSNGLPVNINIIGDLLVSAGAKFRYDPSNSTAASTISFLGSISVQKINSAGTLIFGENTTVQLSNTYAVTPQLTIETDIRLAGTLDIKQGTMHLHPGTITIASTATKTGNVAPINGAITYGSGRFYVERYIAAGVQHGSTWQFLSTPASGTTIKNSWQENGSAVAGYGTRITDPTAPANGFDDYTVRGSMKYFSDGDPSGWVTITNTDQPLANSIGYMLFVRGGRSVGVYDNPSPTTLRTKGMLYANGNAPTPIFVPGNTADGPGFASVGNPYASAVDFTKIRTVSSNIDDLFYVWDPTLVGYHGVGGYQTISGTVNYVPTPSGSAYYPPVRTTTIQSGQAFFVQNSSAAGGTVTFEETVKVTGSRLVNFTGRIGASGIVSRSLFRSQLFTTDGKIADGNVVVFDKRYSDFAGKEDATKFWNTGENMGILSGDRLMAVDGRSPLKRSDTIHYYLHNLREADYQFRFQAENIVQRGLTAMLVDRFLNTRTPISLVDTSVINFAITADAASKVATRFYVIFVPKATIRRHPHADTTKGVAAEIPVQAASMSGYSNPVVNKRVHLQLDNFTTGSYNMELHNTQGQAVLNSVVQINNLLQTKLVILPSSLPAGQYQLTMTGRKGKQTNTKILVQ